jgi:hypothetical protein
VQVGRFCPDFGKQNIGPRAAPSVLIGQGLGVREADGQLILRQGTPAQRTGDGGGVDTAPGRRRTVSGRIASSEVAATTGNKSGFGDQDWVRLVLTQLAGEADAGQQSRKVLLV